MTDTNDAAASPATILQQALDWQAGGAAVALATVVSAWATAPRRAGAQMAVDREGTRCGSLFGPAVDARIAEAALQTLDSRADRLLGVPVDDATALSAGLACGGTMEVRLEAIHDGASGQVAVLRDTLQAVRERRSVVLCTRLADGRRSLWSATAPGEGPWSATARQKARADETGIAAVEGEEVLFQVFNAPLRMFVVGAVTTARALLDAARLIGFELTIIDPRPERVEALDWPGAKLVVDEAGRALREARLDDRSAVVLLSHSPSIDDPAVVEAIGSPAFYIGALGSRRTHAARLERLQQAGFSPAQTARIHGPAGLSIGALGAAEIAASIVAEAISVLRRGEPAA